ncbi:Zinc finger CCCH domain-containing protein 18 [Armadillidium vulgare]|nr:Zinc finger CCCH domain-containing protein 18 [Armadillidium vulgare]
MSEGGNDTSVEDVNEDFDSQDESYVTCRNEMTYVEINDNESVEGDNEQNSTLGKDDSNESVHDHSNSIDDNEDTQDNLRSKKYSSHHRDYVENQIEENHDENDRDGSSIDQSEGTQEENAEDENDFIHSEENYEESNPEVNDQLNNSTDSINNKGNTSFISSPEHEDLLNASEDRENEDKNYDVANIQENEINSSLEEERPRENRRKKKKSSHSNSNNQNSNKRKSDEGLEIRDELDFEEEKEERDKETEIPKEPIHKEEGELTDEDEEDASLRQEPKTVCRFFNKGQCTWGTNCRFLHPGVSDKGNYNMFAAPKPQSQAKEEESSVDKERPRELRRYIPEPVGYESAWERGLRHAKEMMKRANKRKETDADFEEKRFNLSLGQAELDRENDYYTRPASPVYKPSDEVIEYLDPYEKQAIRHFRGGHFENFEVRYKVDQSSYPNRGPEHIRSRRDKFEREVTERVPPRKMRASSPVIIEKHKPVKEKRYPRPTYGGKDDRSQETPIGKGEAEVWADPWARRRTPVKRAKKVSRNRSYSSGSSSGSSRSSRSSSYSSYSRSGSRSTSRSRSSRSSSRSITPPVHPRQQRATMNRGGMRGGRGRGFDRGGGRGGGPPRNFYQQQYSQPPNPPPNHPLAPDVNFLRQNQMGHPGGFPPNRRGRGRDENRFANPRQQNMRNMHQASNDRAPPMQFKQEPRDKNQDTKEKTIPIQRNTNARPNQIDTKERLVFFIQAVAIIIKIRVDMFGRTIRKDVVRSPSKSPKRHPPKPHGRRRFSLSPSRSGSGSRSGSSSSSGTSGSRSRVASHSSRSGSRSSKSRSRSRSSSGSSVTPPPNPVTNKKKVERPRRPVVPPAHPPGTVSYGESNKSKAIDLVKVAGQKQQIKLTLKKAGAPPVKQIDRPVLDVDDDSGESDTDARILKKRKIDVPPVNPDLLPRNQEHHLLQPSRR